MADIRITHDHTLGRDTARTRVAAALLKVKNETGLDGTWQNDTFTAARPIRGTLKVTDADVQVQIDLGFALRLLKNKIETQLKRELAAALK